MFNLRNLLGLPPENNSGVPLPGQRVVADGDDLASMAMPTSAIFELLIDGRARRWRSQTKPAEFEQSLARHQKWIEVKLMQGLEGISGAQEFYESHRFTVFEYLPKWGQGVIQKIIQQQYAEHVRDYQMSAEPLAFQLFKEHEGQKKVNIRLIDFAIPDALKFIGLEACLSTSQLRELHSISMMRQSRAVAQGQSGDVDLEFGRHEIIGVDGLFSVANPLSKGDKARKALELSIPKILKMVAIEDCCRSGVLKLGQSERVALLENDTKPWDILK